MLLSQMIGQNPLICNKDKIGGHHVKGNKEQRNASLIHQSKSKAS